jgi:hypothetical protein
MQMLMASPVSFMDLNLIESLERCNDFPCIFDLVKIAVEVTINRRRVGLILGLQRLPRQIGAFHQLGSNFIIMNKTLLERVLQSRNKKLINAYVFHILLHEYIHSLGYANEQETQIITHAVSEQTLGAGHPATKIARYGIGAVFANIPKLNYRNHETEKNGGIEIVSDIESDNLNYFG